MAVEARRGCGYRKVGGIYLVAPAPNAHCERLPMELKVCPTCAVGVKQARGWTWVGREFLAPLPGERLCPAYCVACHPETLPLKVGLLWIGEKFYPTPADFLWEAKKQGISRRVHKLPRGFDVGNTWVFLAHPKACSAIVPARDEDGVEVKGQTEVEFRPGIFTAFKPEAVQLLLKQSDVTDERREKETKRGVSIVEVPDDDRDHQGSVYEKKKEGEHDALI